MDPVAFIAAKIVATVLMMVTSITGPVSQTAPAIPPPGSATQTTGLRPWANIEVRQVPVKPNGQPKAPTAPSHTSRPATSKPQASTPTAKPKPSPVVFGMADANATTTDQRVYGAGFSAYRKFFSGMPTGWNYGFRGKTEVVSFNAPPRKILSGAYDKVLRAWFAGAPRGKIIYWSYDHEPETGVIHHQYTAAQFRAAYRHIARIAQSVVRHAHAAGKSVHLHSTVILMAIDTAPHSKQNWKLYFPGKKYVDAMSWDGYSFSMNQFRPAPQIFGRAVAVTRLLGKKFAIAETGAEFNHHSHASEVKMAHWLDQMAAYASRQHALYLTYFNLNRWRLSDPITISTYRRIMDRAKH